MIIPHILNNLKKYGISPSVVEQRQLLLKQNLQLVKEINEMKSRLDSTSYAAANKLYKQIIKFDNIMLFKTLLKEQYNNQENNFENFDNDLWYDDDNHNVQNIAFFRQIIFNKKIRNIIKHIVLKKFSSNINYVDHVAQLRELIKYLENIVYNDAREAMRCVYIRILLAELQDYTDLTRNLHGGGRSNINSGRSNINSGRSNINSSRSNINSSRSNINKNNILIGGTKDVNSLLTLFTSCALELKDPKIIAFSKSCMEPLDRFHTPRIANLIDEALKDPTMINPALVAAYIVEPSAQNKQLDDLARRNFTAEETIELKTGVLNITINPNKEKGDKKFSQIVDEAARKASEEAKKADEEAKKAYEEAKKADEEAKKADEEAKKASEAIDTVVTIITEARYFKDDIKYFIEKFDESIKKKGEIVKLTEHKFIKWNWKFYCGVFLLINDKLFDIADAKKIDNKYTFTLPNGKIEIIDEKQVLFIDVLKINTIYNNIVRTKKNIYFEKTDGIITKKTKCSLGVKYEILTGSNSGWAYFIHGDVNAIGYLPNNHGETIRDQQLDENYKIILTSPKSYKQSNFSKKYTNNEQQEEEAVEDGTYKHEYFHDDTEGIIKKYLKYKNKYLEIR
jgi:hypothetical protein